jgi:uncharacterized protein involved in response to NO
VALLHLTFIGGFSLMAFAVATMVVLSHGGAGEHLRQPLPIFTLLAAGLAGALTARLAAEFLPALFFPLLGAAAVCWSASALAWLAFILPHALRPAPAGAFERLHETAKRQLA